MSTSQIKIKTKTSESACTPLLLTLIICDNSTTTCWSGGLVRGRMVTVKTFELTASEFPGGGRTRPRVRYRTAPMTKYVESSVSVSREKKRA